VRPRFPDDGNFIAFPHSADTLVSGDSNGDIDLFLRNVSANTLVRIAQPGTQTTSGSGLLEFSADGERLLFRSSASEYSDPNNEDLFQWTRSTNQVVRFPRWSAPPAQ
jgi:Tol biopolymer transport system component